MTVQGQTVERYRFTPEEVEGTEQMIQRRVASGHYNNQSEVVREALRLLVEQDRLRDAQLGHLRGAPAEALARADRGRLVDGSSIVSEAQAPLRERAGTSESTS